MRMRICLVSCICSLRGHHLAAQLYATVGRRGRRAPRRSVCEPYCLLSRAHSSATENANTCTLRIQYTFVLLFCFVLSSVSFRRFYSLRAEPNRGLLQMEIHLFNEKLAISLLYISLLALSFSLTHIFSLTRSLTLYFSSLALSHC